MSEEDIGTFYFDGEAGRWRRIHIVEVQQGEGVVIAETEHFTDFLNATLAAPDHPTAASFDQNTLANLKLGDPTAGLELIRPPAASSDGAAHLAYHFAVPPGRRGMQPDLTLEYSSDASNGWLGLGWNLAVSKVQVDTRFGTPEYSQSSESELYALDGSELAPQGATAGPKQRALSPAARQPERVFVRRMEGAFSTVIRHGSSPFAGTPNSYSWEVIDKNGTHYYYGTDSSTVLKSPSSGAIAEWLLASVVDTFNNSIHYEYRIDQGTFGSQPWVQVYPSLIRYTDNGSNQGHLYLQFELESDAIPGVLRPDPFTSARAGLLVRTAQRLHALYVAYSPSGVRPNFHESDACADPATPNPPQCSKRRGASTDLVRRYLFTYGTGEYKKSLLQSVDVQGIGFGGTGEFTYDQWSTEQHTALSYYQRPQGSVSAFGPSTPWGNLNSNGQVLSDSSGDSGGAEAFFGIGVCDAVHGGAGAGFNTGTDSTSQSFLDFNGDGLPDFLGRTKVYLGHRAPGAGYLVGSSPFNDDLFSNEQMSEGANVGVHLFQHFGTAGVAWSWDQSKQNGGFADVDGDGLIDWVTPGNTIQRNLGNGALSPFGPFAGQISALDLETQNQIDKHAPRADTVVRWVAPYHGTVAFGGTLQRKASGGGDVLAEIWSASSSTAIWSRVFTATDTGVCIPGNSGSCDGGLTFPVQAGDRFYFLTRAQGDIAGTAMLWDPQFSYQSVCFDTSCSPVSSADHARVEPWGAPVFDFSQSADFRLAGPPDLAWLTQVAADVPVVVKGVFSKPFASADDVTVEVYQTTPTGQVIPKFSQTIPAAQTNVTIDVGQVLMQAGKLPIVVSGTLNGAQLAADALHFRVRSDSPVDPKSFTWDPIVEYQQYCRTPPEEGSTQVCDNVSCPLGPDDSQCTMVGDPMPQQPLRRGQIVQHAPVTYSAYLVDGHPDGAFLVDNQPTRAWVAPEAGPFQATLNYALAPSPAANGADDAVLLIQGNQRLLGKLLVSAGSASIVTLPGLSAAAGEPLFFTALRKGSQEITLSVDLQFTSSGHHFILGPSDLNFHRVKAWDDRAERDNLAGGYQQWSTAQWTEIPPQHDDDALLDDEPPVPFSPASVEATPDQSHASPVTPMMPLPLGRPQNDGQQVPAVPGPSWASSGIDLYITAGEVKPSRSGANPQALIRQYSGAAFRKSHGSSREGSVSAFKFFAQSSSKSTGDTDTLDLNGDRYPDWFDGHTVRYGNAQGGLGDPRGLPLADGVRTFEGDHIRFGISGSGALGGVKQKLGGKGNSTATVGGSAAAGKVYGRTRTTADLVDFNADGLPDRVERSSSGAPFAVYFNLGHSFGPRVDIANVPAFSATVPNDKAGDYQLHGTDEALLRLQTDATNSVQGGISASTGGVGFSGGGGLAYTSTRTTVDFADVNGDGLPDRVLKVPEDPALHVQLNLGESFDAEQIWTLPAWGAELPTGGPLLGLGSRDALAYSESSEFHLDVGVSYETPIYLLICASIEAAVQYRHTHVTSQLVFEDVDGDGFADQLLKNDSTGDVHVKLNQDGAQHFNLLKTIENPIGGRIALDYSREGNTPELPENQWVLASVSVDDGLTGPLHDSVRTSTFQYTGGLYNRDERERFGFAQVTSTRPDQSKLIQSFRQDAVCTKGLPTTTVEQDGAGHLFRSAQTIYDLRAAGAADACFPAATQEISSFFDGITTDPTKPSKALAEQRDYDAFGNVTFYSNAGDTGTLDDLSYTVVYDATLAATHIFRAGVVTAVDAQNKLLRKRQATYYAHGGLKTLSDLVNGGHDPATGNPYLNQFTPNLALTYTAEGNLLTSTDPTGFVLQYGYDATTLSYVTSTQDSFGYVSTATPEPALGVFTSITDINGYTETFNYDRFPDSFPKVSGMVTPRLYSLQAPAEAAQNNANTHVKGPDTIQINYLNSRGLTYSVVKHYDVLHPTDPLETVTFVDGLGRTIQTKKETDIDNGAGGVSHGFSVSGPTIFDERGRVQTQGMPAFNSDADTTLSTVPLTRPTQYQYDILSRPTLVVEPNGGTIGTSYTFGLFDGVQRFITTVTDPNANKRISYQDVRGQVLGVDQFNIIGGTNRTLTTRYSYDPLGELLQVTDAKANKTISVYDTVGHLVDLTSPDSGHVSYRYDLSGRLIAKQTPNLVTGNQVITFAYDFNRLKSMDLPSTAGVIDYQYTYGDPLSSPAGLPGEVGRLIHITDPSGDEARYYDELGRMDSSEFTPTPQSTTAPKPTYTTQFKYDSLNRLLNLTYPDGEVVTYGYDGGGAMTSVSGKFASSTTVTPYVQKITYDEFGQRKNITLGNGVATKYSYDPNMRWLSDINTVTGATTVQNNHYTFDNVGNILTASNNIAIPAPVAPNGPIAPGPTSQTFTYDNLYQLTTASGRYDGCACGCNNHRDYTFAQSYDEIGNIKTKVLTDKITWPTGGRVDTQAKTTYNNSYTYGSTRPHAPTKIGVQNLSYDGNGNQTASTGTFEVGREVTWNELDQLTKEIDSSATNSYVYNSSGERTHKRRTSLETVYVNPYYVIRNLLFQTKHIYAGPTRIVSAVVTLNDYKKLTTTQTPILFYYHSDQLGSTGYVTDRTGQILQHEEYLPSGEAWFEELKNGSATNLRR